MSQPIHGQGAGVPATPKQTNNAEVEGSDWTQEGGPDGGIEYAASGAGLPENPGVTTEQTDWQAGDELSSREPRLIVDEVAPLGDEPITGKRAAGMPVGAHATNTDWSDEPLGSSQDAGSGRSSSEKASELAGQAQDKGRQLADSARGHAENLKNTVTSSGEQVKDVAKEQAVRVAGEAGTQFREVLDEGLREVRAQAQGQQERLAAAVETLVGELGDMAHRTTDSGQSGPLTALAEQASSRGEELVGWLQGRQPEELLDELRGYARRHPWMFLAGAAAAGVLAGRLTRGLIEDDGDQRQPFGEVESAPVDNIDLRSEEPVIGTADTFDTPPMTVYTPDESPAIWDEGARR